MMPTSKKLLVIAGGNYIFGAEKVTLDVVEGLRSRGYEVKAIISGWGDRSFGQRLAALNIDFYKIKLGWYYISKLLWSFDSLVHYPGAVIRFMRIRKYFRDWPVYIISFRQVILLWPFFKKNIVYHVHDNNSTSKQSRFFLKIIDKKVLKYIAVSDFIKKDLVKCGIDPTKIEVIHNGVDLDKDSIAPIVVADPLVVGIVGQIIPRKGHEDIIEAMRILGSNGVNRLVLKIVGNGDIEFVKKLGILIENYGLKNRIQWEGFKTTRAEIYRGIDVVIVPTRNDEPFALVPLEANALSKPVIVTRTGGFPEMVIDGYNGFIIDTSSPEQIAESITRILNDNVARVEMGRNGATRVAQYFDKETMNKKIFELINAL